MFDPCCKSFTKWKDLLIPEGNLKAKTKTLPYKRKQSKSWGLWRRLRWVSTTRMKKIFVQTNAGLKRCTEHPCFPQKWWSCQIKWLLKQVLPGFQLNRILLVLSYIKLWYQSLVQRALPTVHYTDLDPRPVQHPYRGQCKCVCVLWKTVISSSPQHWA